MYYLVTVGFETESPKGTKVQKSKYLIQAYSVEEATIVAAKYVGGDDRSGECLSVVKFPVEEVLDEKNSPEYYKTK